MATLQADEESTSPTWAQEVTGLHLEHFEKAMSNRLNICQ